MKVVALAGGVGGAKLADGLAQVLPPGDLTVIVNTGDDFDFLGLHICPDLDTVCYTLAGLANPATGWGRQGDTWNAFESLSSLGGPSWFHLGDKDLGVHLERTRRLALGQPLSSITRDFCQAWGVQSLVLPMSDDPAPTMVDSDEGRLPFQEYFVHRQCQPHVTGFEFQGIQQARPTPGVLEAIRSADRVIIAPSNPWVSIAPILSVPGIRQAMAGCQVTAVSPIIGGKAVKGPAAKMFAELGIDPSAQAVAKQYIDLLTDFVLDVIDADQQKAVRAMGMRCLVAQTLMQTSVDRKRLAAEILNF